MFMQCMKLEAVCASGAVGEEEEEEGGALMECYDCRLHQKNIKGQE